MTNKNKKLQEKEITGGELTDAPNDKYRIFFEKFAEINTLPINEWKTVHVLGYFCKKYSEFYNTKYQFKFNSPNPSKSFEVFQIKKMASMLSSNPQILVDYIDWVYNTRVKESSRRLTSISFLTVEPLLNYYKLNILLAGKKNISINRSTELPEKYKSIILNNIGKKINTYGDLSFAYQAVQSGSVDNSIETINNWNRTMELLYSAGLDKSILGSLK
jgi:hypothetical protein